MIIFRFKQYEKLRADAEYLLASALIVFFV